MLSIRFYVLIALTIVVVLSANHAVTHPHTSNHIVNTHSHPIHHASATNAHEHKPVPPAARHIPPSKPKTNPVPVQNSPTGSSSEHKQLRYDEIAMIDMSKMDKNVTRIKEYLKFYREAGIVPVVFISYGNPMKYIQFNIEMASRLNPVIVISDVFLESAILVDENRNKNKHEQNQAIGTNAIIYLALDRHLNNLGDFTTIYKPVHITYEKPERQRYELLCITRWLVLNNLCNQFNVPRVFYADNDVAVYGNMTTAFNTRRSVKHCDVMISVEGTQSVDDVHSTACGHSSFWTATALSDLSVFLFDLYTHHINSLTLSDVRPANQKNGRNRVVDMTLLYLYYVAHMRNATMGWDTGRPQSITHMLAPEPKMLQKQENYDRKFKFLRDNLKLPVVKDSGLVFCSGLDVHDRTAFDHMHGTMHPDFSLGTDLMKAKSFQAHDTAALNGKSHSAHSVVHSSGSNSSVAVPTVVEDPYKYYLPYIVGVTTWFGGRSESVDDEKEIKRLAKSRLYMYTIHYQANRKYLVEFDVCRRLVSKTQLFLETHSDYSDSRNSSSGSGSGGSGSSSHSSGGKHHNTELHKLFAMQENSPELQEAMLAGITSPFVRSECAYILSHKIPTYQEVFGPMEKWRRSLL